MNESQGGVEETQGVAYELFQEIPHTSHGVTMLGLLTAFLLTYSSMVKAHFSEDPELLGRHLEGLKCSSTSFHHLQ
ncbi:hypothetical protein TcWFU_005061 [Taenia crassiceps]|uniref:Uncharacterized protein n=1 Tax=Taenia crassiceps TaxID=6207 RepID=A0ABR4Q3J3_9CEST